MHRSAVRESLQNIENLLEALLKEVGNMREYVDDIEKAVIGKPVAPVKRKAGRKASRKEARKKAGKKQAHKIRGKKKKTQAEQVISVIQKNPDGISAGVIIKEKGLEKKAVYGVLNRAKKDRKVKSPKRGVYVPA